MPWPVALARPSDPPMRTSLPVTTPRMACGVLAPSVNWRIIIAMISGFVLTSGAGMSTYGPMRFFSL